MPARTLSLRSLIGAAAAAVLAAGCANGGARPGAVPERPGAALAGAGFRLEPVYVITVHVPDADVERVLAGIVATAPLRYGPFDQVAFLSASGIEQFRPRQGSRAGEQAYASRVATTRITFSIGREPELLRAVLAAIRDRHPYEEPVLFVTASYASRATRDLAEDHNPNRWWNREPPAEAPAAAPVDATVAQPGQPVLPSPSPVQRAPAKKGRAS
jgi:hypothetical protein